MDVVRCLSFVAVYNFGIRDDRERQTPSATLDERMRLVSCLALAARGEGRATAMSEPSARFSISSILCYCSRESLKRDPLFSVEVVTMVMNNIHCRLNPCTVPSRGTWYLYRYSAFPFKFTVY